MATPAALLSEVRFASFFVYAPDRSFESEPAVQSRRAVQMFKHDQPPWIQRAAARVARDHPLEFADFLGPRATLVPAPRSAPLRDPEFLWPARRIAEELVRANLGASVLPCLLRSTKVAKSAFVPAEERPKALEHFESMTVEPSTLATGSITVVDDVVTRGATLLAAASRLQAAFPASEVRAFAFFRTMSRQDIGQLIDPCTGTITLEGDETWRRP